MTNRLSAAEINRFSHACFRAVGVCEEDAQICAQAFTLQELRGGKTHGLRRLRGMLDMVLDGSAVGEPERSIVSERGATLVYDGGKGLGIPSCMGAMRHALRLAKAYGIGMATVVNSNHFLAAAPYCIEAAQAGAVGLAFANGSKGMAYPGTNVGAIGNSPMGFGLPTDEGYEMIFDAALTLSGGKLTMWSKEGKEIPAGFLGYDAQGNYTTDAAAMVDGGTPLPIGMHKGAGLAILIDVITGLIAGSTFLRDLIPPEHPDWKRTTNTHTFIAIDIARYMPLPLFKERMRAYVADLKAKPLAPGYDEILMPGERAARYHAVAAESGVEIAGDLWEKLEALSARFGVAMPQPL